MIPRAGPEGVQKKKKSLSSAGNRFQPCPSNSYIIMLNKVINLLIIILP
jgi:hypothetical protein